MGFLDTVSKAKAFDQVQNRRQQQDSVDAATLNELKAQKQMQEQTARDALLYQTGQEEGSNMANALNQGIAAGVYNAPKQDVPMQYAPDKYGIPIPVPTPDQAQGGLAAQSQGQQVQGQSVEQQLVQEAANMGMTPDQFIQYMQKASQ